METENQSKHFKIIFPEPYPAQKKVIKSCMNAYTRYTTLVASRQSGKTAISIIVALMWALGDPNQDIMFVSPIDGQSKKIFAQIEKMVGHLPIIKSKRSQSGFAEFQFINGSIIRFRSAASRDSLRGYSLTHLILDECAFMEEETYQTVLAPTLSVRGKKILFSSTPKGKNFFYKLYMKGKNDMNVYKSYKILYTENPYANKEFIEEQKEQIMPDAFKQEYLCEFIDQAGVFSNVDDISTATHINEPVKNHVYYMGIDIAFKKDFTVVSVLNQKGEMVHMKRFNKLEGPEIKAEIKRVYNLFRPRKCYMELNNQGLPLYHDLRRDGLWNIEGFDTSTESKPRIINNLIAACNNKEIKLLNDNIVKDEFKAFGFTVTKTGAVKFAASYGADDIVMATAIAWECYNKNKWNGAGYTIM